MENRYKTILNNQVQKDVNKIEKAELKKKVDKLIGIAENIKKNILNLKIIILCCAIKDDKNKSYYCLFEYFANSI